MHAFLQHLAQHGYIVIFLLMFAEAVGLPVPAAIAVIAAGAAAATGAMNPFAIILIGALGSLFGDVVLFLIGRRTGWGLLGFLCKVSLNPETCILRSAQSFYARGRATLVIAKFIPGLNTMAPPLAGSMKMRTSQFLLFDSLGAFVYSGAFFALGFVFSRFIERITGWFESAGRVVTWALVAGIIIYLLYRVWLYKRQSYLREVPRVTVAELASRLSLPGAEDQIVIADVRSHGYYDSGAQRIEHSVRIEPNDLERSLERFSRERQIYLYCT